ncbi:MAG: dTDP-4-dehydrorhamnose reductase [Pyrinomonadaceae bacterium]|nr:dTDP-4-dehydrorhamnose reductase [Pyrinomonadaceae bacterium]
MRVLITGAGGLVGRAVSEHCAAREDDVLTYDHRSLDITNVALVTATIDKQLPDVVINCAAWTDVDGCEFDHARSIAVNAQGPENLATASRKVGATLITISTDYVFDGTKKGFYTQRDDPNPKSSYGAAKLAGEQRSQQAFARTVVVRTGFIFGPGGTNFLSTVVERGMRGESMKAISDAWGTPTYAPHLAVRLRELAERDLPGVFHVVNSGDGASFEGFTRAALRAAGCDETKVETVTMESLHRPAPRPANSRLRCLLSEAIGLEPLPNWEDALQEYVASQKRAEMAAQS